MNGVIMQRMQAAWRQSAQGEPAVHASPRLAPCGSREPALREKFEDLHHPHHPLPLFDKLQTFDTVRIIDGCD
jgi:hypothetical protein